MKEKEQIGIVEWFDIRDKNHLKAYNHLCERGSWPKGFIPSNVVCDNVWQVSIAAKMAHAYIKQQLA